MFKLALILMVSLGFLTACSKSSTRATAGASTRDEEVIVSSTYVSECAPLALGSGEGSGSSVRGVFQLSINAAGSGEFVFDGGDVDDDPTTVCAAVDLANGSAIPFYTNVSYPSLALDNSRYLKLSIGDEGSGSGFVYLLYQENGVNFRVFNEINMKESSDDYLLDNSSTAQDFDADDSQNSLEAELQ